jgi:Domain of unknown function (DUF4214)
MKRCQQNASRIGTRRNWARPAVEELEDRCLLSAATLSVAEQIVHSPESYQDFVTTQYNIFLNRAPDSAGLTAWVRGLESGLSYEQVEAGLAASPEFISDNGGLGSGWLTALYKDFLGRSPDTSGLDAWQGALASGTSPYQIALDFATSAEREADVITEDYLHFLGRLPESGAVAGWQAQLQNGLTQADLQANIVGSAEFYTHAGNTDTNFITAAYQDILGRTPSQAEINLWLPLVSGPATSPGDAPSSSNLVTLTLNPLNINLLGLQVATNQIQVTISAQSGQGDLLGNLLSDVSGLLNLQGVNNALNNVLGSVVTLLNSASLSVANVNTASGPLSSSTTTATTPVLSLHVAPVHLNLLGALVDTSPIDLTITAQSGNGLILGNVITDLANLFNPPLPSQLNLNDINTKLEQLLNELNAQIPGIPSAPSTPPTSAPGSEQVLALSVPPLDLNLLGLLLTTSQIQVNASATTGNGELLGNVLTTLLNTLGATPQNLTTLNDNLNALLAKVVGVLNAATLTLPSGAVNSLSQVLQTLALPNLVNQTGTASTPILNLAIASSNSTTPPVDVNLLGLTVTTSNIQAQIVAQTGNGQVLGNLLYNVANLLNPGGDLSLLTILNQLGL